MIKTNEINLIPIFDNGHGGVINSKYQTAGKRSPNWDKGVLYEGAFNRWVVNRLIEKMDRNNLPYYHLSPELEDISISKRIVRAREIHNLNKNTYILSIHANAGGGSGIEAFTSVGQTKSDDIAEKFLCNMESDLSEKIGFRFDFRDGDRDKEDNRISILSKSPQPAVLLELGFMDNKNDYDLLWSESYLEACVNSIFRTILEL